MSDYEIILLQSAMTRGKFQYPFSIPIHDSNVTKFETFNFMQDTNHQIQG